MCGQGLDDPTARVAADMAIDRAIANSEVQVADFERLERQLAGAVEALRLIRARVRASSKRSALTDEIERLADEALSAASGGQYDDPPCQACGLPIDQCRGGQ